MGKPGRPCTICQHPNREEIDKLLASSDANFAGISQDFAGISEDALRRHKESHFPEALAKAEDIREIASADSLLDELQKARQRTYDLLDKAEEAASVKVYGAPVQYLREIREQIKLLAELEGRLAAQPQINLTQVNIYNSPEWLAVGSILARILAQYPELRAEVAREFLVLEEANR